MTTDDFRLEAQLLAENPPSVERLQKELLNAYLRGFRAGGIHALDAVERAFGEEREERNGTENSRESTGTVR